MSITLPGHAEGITLFPSSKDAYLVISDLNHFATGEAHRATFLSLPSAPRITFALELLESVLSNHAPLFASSSPGEKNGQQRHTHPELQHVLRQMTCPLLIKALSSSHGLDPHAGGLAFSIQVRLMRLLFLLLRKFTKELDVEAEVLFTILLRALPSSSSTQGVNDAKNARRESASSMDGQQTALPWQRVLALEIVRSLTSDADLLRYLWTRYDDSDSEEGSDPGAQRFVTASGAGASSGLVKRLVEELCRLVTEDSSLVDRRIAREQLGSAPVSSSGGGDARASVDRSSARALYEAAAGAFSAAAQGSAGGDARNGQLSVTAIPTVQVIDQLDKADAPSTPPTYSYLLALYSLANVVACATNHVLPAYSSFVNARPKNSPRAPGTLDVDAVPARSLQKSLLSTKRMLIHIWQPLLTSFDFLLTTKSDEVLWAEVLNAWRNLANVAGVLSLFEARDALLSSLVKFAAPAGIVSAAMDQRRPSSVTAQQANNSAGNVAGGDSTGADAVSGGMAQLSKRNLASLKAFLHSVYYLSGSLAGFWYKALSAIVDAEFVLLKMSAAGIRTSSSMQGSRPPFSVAPVDASSGIPAILMDLDAGTLITEIARVVENTAALGSDSLLQFLNAACRLSAEVALSPSPEGKATATQSKAALLDTKGRSIILNHVTVVWTLNAERLVLGEPDLGWSVVVDHVLKVLSENTAPPNVRMQAAAFLSSITLGAMATSAQHQDGKLHERIQKQVFDALETQALLSHRRSFVVDIEIRRLALETMLKIAEVHGHTIIHGWDSIFIACGAACDQVEAKKAAGGKAVRSAAPLIKVAFALLQKVASDLLPSLSEKQLRASIDDFASFTLQPEDVNVSLSAVGALWGVTADVQRRCQEDGRDASALWQHLLQRMSDMCSDLRSDVRDAAVTALFRVLEQYGSTYSPQLWQSVILNIVFPLMDALQTGHEAILKDENPTVAALDERKAMLGEAQSSPKQWISTRATALTRLGEVFAEFLPTHILHCDAFEEIWKKLIGLLDSTFRSGPAVLSQRAMEAKLAVLSVGVVQHHTLGSKHVEAHNSAWQVWSTLAVDARGEQRPEHLTQENLLAAVKAAASIYRGIPQAFDLSRLKQLFASLRTFLLFPSAGTAAKDIDTLTPLQHAVRELLLSITPVPGAKALLIDEMSQISTLAYVHQEASQFTFVALAKATVMDLRRLFVESHVEKEIYQEGAVATLLSVSEIR